MRQGAQAIRETVEELILDPSDPLPSARAFVGERHVVEDVLALRHHAGVFFEFDTTAYRECDEAAVRAALYDFLEPAKRWSKPLRGQKPKLVAFQPNKGKIENVV